MPSPQSLHWQWLGRFAQPNAGALARRRCNALRTRQLIGRRWLSRQPGILHHEHLRGDGPGGMVSYHLAETIQEEHRADFLKYKSLSEKEAAGASIPAPRLITFESTPTFTLGRRQDVLSPQDKKILEQELIVDLPNREEPIHGTMIPQVKKTNRGGLTTYHGPGQLVIWPVLDMHSSLYPKLGVASYASLLETTTQRLLTELYNIETYTDRDEPGVWVTTNQRPRKIAAMGVHHRRHVTALGIALNVDIPVTGEQTTNVWQRFVPCGLEGKAVTSIAAELDPSTEESWNLPDLAARWADLFQQGLSKG